MAVAFRVLIAAGILTLSARAAAQDEEPPWSAPDDDPASLEEPDQLPPEDHYSEPPEAVSPPAETAPPVRRQQRPRRRVDQPGVYEPPPPGHYGAPVASEPPPPPKPRHVAPKTAFWVGARLGYFVPFGNLWEWGTPVPGGIVFESVPWRDYATSGPVLELDVGARLGRQYNLFVLWERAQLGAGDAPYPEDIPNDMGVQDGGETDYWALGLRANSDPNRVGLVTEMTIGYRQFRAVWKDGRELRTVNAPFEARLGIGAEIRVNRGLSFTPMLTLGTGAFYDINDGDGRPLTNRNDGVGAHYWFTAHVGGHFDIAGAN